LQKYCNNNSSNKNKMANERKEINKIGAQVNYEITQVLIEFYTRAEFTNGDCD